VPTHWTYRDFAPTDGLFQGDIIAREPLLEVLGNVHKHFCDSKYLAFIVLTQTCDLVVRDKACKAKHIALAVVRPLSSLVPTVLSELCSSPHAGLFPQDRRKTVEEFFDRVLNQNEQAEGWVYLHPDGDVGIGEPAVAMLRISIALRAREHYELIRKARCGRLDTEYRNKLGWLMGNLYSRIDTTDWAEKSSGEEEEKKIIGELLDTPIEGKPPLWVPPTWIAAARTAKVNFKETPHDQLQSVLQKHAPPPPLDAALAEVRRVTNNLRNEFTDAPVVAFQVLVDNDPALLPLVTRQIVAAVQRAVGVHADDRLWQFAEAVTTDDYLLNQIATTLKQFAADFLKRKGARQVGLFVESLPALSYLSADAVGRISFLAEEAYQAAFLDKSAEANAAVSALKCPPSLVAHLRTAAVTAIQDSVAELVVGRLTNSVAFKKTLKAE
jgi:hypothetical protein